MWYVNLTYALGCLVPLLLWFTLNLNHQRPLLWRIAMFSGMVLWIVALGLLIIPGDYRKYSPLLAVVGTVIKLLGVFITYARGLSATERAAVLPRLLRYGAGALVVIPLVTFFYDVATTQRRAARLDEETTRAVIALYNTLRPMPAQLAQVQEQVASLKASQDSINLARAEQLGTIEKKIGVALLPKKKAPPADRPLRSVPAQRPTTSDTVKQEKRKTWLQRIFSDRRQFSDSTRVADGRQRPLP